MKLEKFCVSKVNRVKLIVRRQTKWEGVIKVHIKYWRMADVADYLQKSTKPVSFLKFGAFTVVVTLIRGGVPSAQSLLHLTQLYCYNLFQLCHSGNLKHLLQLSS